MSRPKTQIIVLTIYTVLSYHLTFLLIDINNFLHITIFGLSQWGGINTAYANKKHCLITQDLHITYTVHSVNIYTCILKNNICSQGYKKSASNSAKIIENKWIKKSIFSGKVRSGHLPNRNYLRSGSSAE